ncbi:RecQ-like DNA helicase blm-1, partial [Acropora cervicornis]
MTPLIKIALSQLSDGDQTNNISQELSVKLHKLEANLNRENIFYRVLPRGNRGDEKLIDVIKPYALELKEQVISNPLTIFYSNLETCGECYSYFEQELGEQQFYPPGSPAKFSNRLFAQYHAQYPEEYRTSLSVFVTVAFGVGMDVPTVERVIHIGIPYTMEDFFQETGRARRNGNSAMH